MTKALGQTYRDKTPGGAPRLCWGRGSAVIQEFPPGVTVLPWGGDTAVSAGSAALGYPGGTGLGTKMASKSIKTSGSEEQPPQRQSWGHRRGLGAQSVPLVPPILQEWDRDLWGDTGQGKGSSQNLGPSWPWGSGKIPVWGLCCFRHPNSCLHPPIPWASCSSRGNPTPRSCLSSEKI